MKNMCRIINTPTNYCSVSNNRFNNRVGHAATHPPTPTFRVQEPGDTVLSLRNVKGRLHAFARPLALHAAPVDQVGPVPVYDSAEG